MDKKQFFEKMVINICEKLAISNQKHSRLSETKKFYSGYVIALGPWFICEVMAFAASSRWFDLLGMAWIIFILGTRIWWFEGDLKEWLPSDDAIELTEIVEEDDTEG